MDFFQTDIIQTSLCIFAVLVAITTLSAVALFFIRMWMDRTRPDYAASIGLNGFVSTPIHKPPDKYGGSSSTTSTDSIAPYRWFGEPGLQMSGKPGTSETSRKSRAKEFRQFKWPLGLATLTGENSISGLKKSTPCYLDLIASTGSPFMFKKRYLTKELLSLRPVPVRDPPPDDHIQLSSLLRYECTLPTSGWVSLQNFERSVSECTVFLQLADPATKNLGLFKLLHLGASDQVYSNPVHFFESYCFIVILAVHTLAISTQSPDLQSLVVDVVSCFCWEHWHLLYLLTTKKEQHSLGAKSLDSLYKQYFLVHNLEPFKLSRPAIYGIFVELCTHALASRPKSEATRRLVALFLECAAETECLEYDLMLPYLARAVTSSYKSSTKSFFYVVLLETVKPHIHCCLKAQDVYSLESVLHALIRHGLDASSTSVIEKVTQLCRAIGERFAELTIWATTEPPVRANSEIAISYVAPGAWRPFQ